MSLLGSCLNVTVRALFPTCADALNVDVQVFYTNAWRPVIARPKMRPIIRQYT
jgi:hypothetical protein